MSSTGARGASHRHIIINVLCDAQCYYALGLCIIYTVHIIIYTCIFDGTRKVSHVRFGPLARQMTSSVDRRAEDYEF